MSNIEFDTVPVSTYSIRKY